MHTPPSGPVCRRFALAASLLPTLSGVALAASHREAPLISLDPAADITDVYAFVSYDADNLARSPADRKVTLIMNVIPGEEPSSGPNYYSFDDGVLYAFHVDNDRDGVDDVTYEVRFDDRHGRASPAQHHREREPDGAAADHGARGPRRGGPRRASSATR